MIEMSVAGLALDASNRTPIVLLRDPSGRRQVPIWIEKAQADSILAGFQTSSANSSTTHDLIVRLLKEGQLNLERVIIHSMDKNTFQAVLKLSRINSQKESKNDESGLTIEIEARPSDAIALAVRWQCSIWMLESVFSEASIPVDSEADKADQIEFRRFLDQINPDSLIKHLKDKDGNGEGK